MVSAIGAWLAALFLGIVTYYFLGDIPEIGHLLYVLGWICVIGLVLLGIWLMVRNRRPV